MIKIRFIYAFLFAAFGHTLYSQNFTINGEVRDDSVLKPVSYAHIYVLDVAHNFAVSTFSSLEGKFTITIPAKYANDTLHVSLLGFFRKDVLIRLLNTKIDVIIDLQQAATLLPAVTVHGLTAREIILKALANVSRNYADISFYNKCFFWESVKENNAFKNLTQGNLLIEETVKKSNVTRSISRDFVTSFKPQTHLVFLDSIENAFYFDFVRASSGIMNTANINEWEFSYDHENPIPGDFSLINGRRLDKSMTMRVLVNERDYAVERIEYAYRWKKGQYHHLNDTLAYSLNGLKGTVMYKKNATRYNIKYLFVEVSYTTFKIKGYRTYHRILDREIKHEIVVQSSFESQVGRNENVSLPYGDKIKSEPIVNTSAYCNAARALGISTLYCQ
jgi:hypothetical protein